MRCKNCGSEKIISDRSLDGRYACSVCGSTQIELTMRTNSKQHLISYVLIYDHGTDKEAWYNTGNGKEICIPIFKNSLDAIAHAETMRKAGYEEYPKAVEVYTKEFENRLKQYNYKPIYVQPGDLSQLPNYKEGDAAKVAQAKNSSERTSTDSDAYNAAGAISSIMVFLVCVIGAIPIFQSCTSNFQTATKKEQSDTNMKDNQEEQSDTNMKDNQEEQSDTNMKDNQEEQTDNTIMQKPYHNNFDKINSPIEVLEYLHYSEIDITVCPEQYTWMDNLAVSNYDEYCKKEWENVGKLVKKPNLDQIAENQSLKYLSDLNKKCELNPAQSSNLPMGRPGTSADSTASFIFQGGLDSVIKNNYLKESMLKHSSNSQDRGNICNHLNAPGARDYIKALYTTAVAKPSDNPKYFALTIPAELLENALVGKQYNVYGRLENRTDGNIWITFHGNAHISKMQKYISLELANKKLNKKL